MAFKFSFLILFSVVFLFFFFVNIKAATPLDAVINEITWMGTNVSANDEWIELYNNTQNNINLDNWVLKSEDGTPEIKLTGIISANGFFLLERTNDETVPGAAADQIYKGALGNNGENLKLFDGSENLIDQVNCSSGWFFGDNKTKQTMERKNSRISGSDSTNWQSSQNSGGTPKAKNPEGVPLPTEPYGASSEQKTINNEQKIEKLAASSSPPNLIEKKEYPSGIVINEILPSPTGPDTEEEWIELFNQNNFEADLSGWKIKDASGKITTYTFPNGTKLSPQGFLVLARPETKITLNNDEDGLILLSPDGNVVDKVNYEKAPKGKSYNRVNSDWLWSPTLTPGTPNITEKTEKTLAPEDKEKRELAAVGEPIRQAQGKQIPKSLSVFLIALSLAIFSGIVIFILKKTTTRPPHPPKQSLGPY